MPRADERLKLLKCSNMVEPDVGKDLLPTYLARAQKSEYAGKIPIERDLP